MVSDDRSEQAGIAAGLRLHLRVAFVERQVEPPDVFADRGANGNPAQDSIRPTQTRQDELWISNTSHIQLQKSPLLFMVALSVLPPPRHRSEPTDHEKRNTAEVRSPAGVNKALLC